MLPFLRNRSNVSIGVDTAYQPLRDSGLKRARRNVVVGRADQPVEITSFNVIRINDDEMTDAHVGKLLDYVRAATAEPDSGTCSAHDSTT